MRIKEQSTAEQLLQVCDRVVEMGKELADEVSCCVQGKNHFLTRYANNQIIQNVRKNEIELIVKVWVDGKIGTASCNQLDDASLRQVLRKAVELARYVPKDPYFAGFVDPMEIPQVQSYDERSDQVTPMDLANAVREITERTASQGLEAAGACQLLLIDQVVANSRGVRLSGRRSKAQIHAVVMGPNGSGYAEDVNKSFFALKPAEVAHVAIEKCVSSANPVTLEPGDYPVILEPKAVGDLLCYVGAFGFNPISYHEGQSFLSGKMGERILSEKISIFEDPLSENHLSFSFDWDGHPKQKVALIQNGVAKGMIYDHYHAQKYQTSSTGNAGYPLETRLFGPIPSNLALEPGDTALEEMIRGTERGILVTRFHYLGMIQSRQSVVTGMTRDGTFLVENGKIMAPVKNLRFTQSFVSALSKVRGVGDKAKLVGSHIGISLVPALWLDSFRFTGVADH